MDKELASMHDAEIVFVNINKPDKKLILGFQTQKAPTDKLCLENVSAFRVNNLIKQNIVSRIITSLSHSMSDDDITKWVTWINSLDSEVMIKPEAVQSYVNKIKNNEMILLIIEPSWGAEVAAICESLGFIS